MQSRDSSLTGFVLAGGASRRMGRPKASLQLDGEHMLERQIRVLRSVARRVAVVGSSPGCPVKFDAPCFPDAIAGRGPLGGIYTALLECRTEFSLVLGCDLPFVNSRLLAGWRCVQWQTAVTSPFLAHGTDGYSRCVPFTAAVRSTSFAQGSRWKRTSPAVSSGGFGAPSSRGGNWLALVSVRLFSTT
jgi:molybdopterin-guanine dinucleotide biosynthesis protein A